MKQRRQPKRRAGGGHMIALGMFIASILDPKTKVMTELIDQKQRGVHTDPGKKNA